MRAGTRAGRGVGETGGVPVSQLPPHLYVQVEPREFDVFATVALAGVGVWVTAHTIDNLRQGSTMYLREMGWAPAGAAPPARADVTFRVLLQGLPVPGYQGIRGDGVGDISALSSVVVVLAENTIAQIQVRDDVGGINRSAAVRAYGWSAPLSVSGES